MSRGILTTAEIAEEFSKQILADKYKKKIKVSIKDINNNLVDVIEIPEEVYEKSNGQTLTIKFE